MDVEKKLFLWLNIERFSKNYRKNEGRIYMDIENKKFFFMTEYRKVFIKLLKDGGRSLNECWEKSFFNG